MIQGLAAAAKALAFLGLTLPLMPVQALLLKLDVPAARALPQAYHRLLCRILRVELELEGKAPHSGLIVCNHISWLDIPVLSAAARVSFVAKREVATWPLFGALAKLQRSTFIDRERRHSTGQSRNEMMARLRAGELLVLFPEGTSHNGRHLKPFKSAYLGAVENSDVPVIPASLIYLTQHGLPLTLRQRPSLAWYGDMDLLPHLWAMLKAGPIRVRLIFHPPLAPAGRKALTQAAEAAIRKALAENLHAGPKIG